MNWRWNQRSVHVAGREKKPNKWSDGATDVVEIAGSDQLNEPVPFLVRASASVAIASSSTATLLKMFQELCARLVAHSRIIKGGREASSVPRHRPAVVHSVDTVIVVWWL